MKRFLLFIVLLGLPALFTGTAEAHVLKTDGDIGAVLHINPDDNPTSGTPVSYILSFTDTSGRMTLPNCACGATVLENGKQIAQEPLSDTSAMQSNDTLTFPKAGVYVLQVSGAPKEADAFQPFVLRYTVRVTSGQPTAQPFPVLLWVGIATTMALLLLVAYKQGIEYDTKEQEGDKK